MSRFVRDRTGPLYLDLDGTLLATDSLWESLVLLALRRPLDALRVLTRLLGPRAAVKRFVAERVQPAASRLPLRPEVVALAEEARAHGRPVVLATAADSAIAEAVAQAMGGFDDVLSSDGETNLKGAAKAQAIQKHAGDRPFDYVGNDASDLPIWRAAGRAMLADATASTLRRAQSQGEVEVVAPRSGRAAALWRGMRPYQWSKNALLWVPLVLAHELQSIERIGGVAVAFVCFCLVASATYLWNDLLDVEADRAHPTKRLRPLASGALPVPVAVAAIVGGVTLGIAISSALLPAAATRMLGLYLLLTSAYSFRLKERLYVDVLVLAGLYTVRVLAGGVAADVPVSPWLLAFSMFFFLSLAFVKRYAELLSARDRDATALARRSYEVGDLGLVETMGITSGYISVLVLGLYVSNDTVTHLYPMPQALWLVSPIMLYWLTRLWFLARRGELSEDPVLFAIRDPASYVAGLLIGLVGVVASLGL